MTGLRISPSCCSVRSIPSGAGPQSPEADMLGGDSNVTGGRTRRQRKRQGRASDTSTYTSGLKRNTFEFAV
jgi:hypothetical protein